MRRISNEMAEALDARVVLPIMMIKAEFTSGNLCFWSGYGDLVWGGATYLGTGQLLNYGGITEDIKNDTKSIDISLSGLSTSIRSIALSEDYQDRPVTIYFGCRNYFNNNNVFNDDVDYIFQDDINYIFNSKELGDVVIDPFPIFSGYMDVLTLEESFGESSTSVVASMTIESIFSKLSSNFNSQYSPEHQKSYYPNDKGLDFIVSLRQKEILWGRQ